MSGDVQPRKRKDKKKRKDEDDHWTTSEEIHVDHDAHTGGSICGKLIFFFLFGLLAVFIALALKNHELNELEIRQEEYKSSGILNAWLGEEAPDDHDDHDVHSEEVDVLEDEEDDLQSEEPESQEIEEEEEEEEENHDDEEYETDEVTESEQDEDDVTKSEEVEESEEKDQEETEEEQDEESPEQDKEEEDESAEIVTDVDVSEEKQGKDDEEAIAEEAQVLDAGSQEEKSTATDQEATPDAEETSSAMKATKIGIGLVLLAVAYNLFFRKRRFAIDVVGVPSSSPSTSSPKNKEHEPTPDLSRRNTLVAPPPLQVVEPDLPDVEPEFDEEYSDEEYSEEEEKAPSARDQYQELRTAYSRSLSPDGVDLGHENEETYEEEVEEEEEIDEELEEEEDFERYDEDEDEELLKRLEAKYGKLGRDEPDTESDRETEEQAAKTDSTVNEDIQKAEQQIKKEH